MAKRTITLEIDGRTLSKETRQRWMDCSRRLMVLCNYYLTEWEKFHERNESGVKLQKWVNDLKEWHRADKSTRGKKPVCPVSFDDAGLRSVLNAGMNSIGLHVNSKVKSLIQNWLRRTMTTSSSGFARWINALLYRDRLSRFTHPVPIPLMKANASIGFRESEKGHELWCKVRVDRVEKEGQRGGSHQDEFRLVAGGKVRRYAAPVWAEAMREKPVLQSAKLIWKEHRRKWFLAVCVDVPDEIKPDLDPENTLIVYPSFRRPLKVRVNGRTRSVSGDGYHVAMTRGTIQKQRRSRQANYRVAMGRGKGQGRRRAIESWEGKLERKWRSFCKLNNDNWSKSVVEAAVAAGAGKIVVIQPSLGDRFLDVAGNIQPNKTGWPWYELGRMISEKATRLGIKVTVVSELRERRCKTPFIAG